MKRLQIMVSIDGSVKHCSFWNICSICRVLSARAVGPAWTRNSRTDSPSNRFYASLATRMFPLPWIKTVFFLHSDNRTTADGWKCCTTVHFTDLVSNRFWPTVFWSLVTTFVCTSTTFVNASWQSAGWSWWHVVPLFSRRYCGCSISESSLIPMPWTWCRSSNKFQW